MKRFQFRLERLLRLRQQKDRQAEARQQTARQAWESAQAQADALLARLVESASAVEARIGHAIETDRWVARFQHMTQVRAALDTAQQNARRAMTTLEAANDLRKVTAAEVDSLQQLREQQWHQHRRETTQAEQRLLDDLYLHREHSSQLTAAGHPAANGDALS